MGWFYILYLIIILPFSHQQDIFTQRQQNQEMKDNELEKNILKKLQPFVAEFAKSVFENIAETQRQEFQAELSQLKMQMNNLSEISASISEAYNNITAAAQGPKVLGCPDLPLGDPQYLYFGENCFLFSTGKLSWDRAKSTCQQLGAKLARSDTAEINDYLKDKARNTGFRYWIGGHDSNIEGVWIWDDNGDAITSGESDWSPGEPNDYGSGQDCLIVGHGSAKRWDDDICTSRNNYICQKSPEYISVTKK